MSALGSGFMPPSAVSAASVAGAAGSVQAMLQGASLGTSLFPPTSRYAAVGTATMTVADGQTVTYLRRRFVPDPRRFAMLRLHVVRRNDRPDTLAVQYGGHPGDPEQFWRIADANGVLRPQELVERIGAVVRITLPEGIPGPHGG